jgi:hypothetical protein
MMRVAVSMVGLLLVASLPANAQSANPGPATGADSGQGTAAGSGTSSSMLPSEAAAKARLESAGYTDVRDVKSGPEAMTAKAVKDGRQMDIVIDSFGKIIARPAE